MWTWLHWPNPRFVTSSWVWKSLLLHNNDNKSLRSKSRRKNNPSWQQPQHAPRTSTVTRSSCLPPVTTRLTHSRPRLSGASELYQLLTFIFVLITSMCRLMISRKLDSPIFCLRTYWRSLLSYLISGHRLVWFENNSLFIIRMKILPVQAKPKTIYFIAMRTNYHILHPLPFCRSNKAILILTWLYLFNRYLAISMA